MFVAKCAYLTYFERGDKAILNYIHFGNGENVIFLHGWGGSIESFLFAAKRLPAKYACTLVDFYGFGKTTEPEVPLTVSDYADAVVDVMTELEIEKAVFVCHSFGGRVGIELAVKRPNIVKKLVLVDSAGIKPRRKLSYYLKVWTHKLLKKIGCGLKGSNDFRMLSPIMKQTFINVVNYDQTADTKKIACETAIFWGKKDNETPPYMAKKLKKNIPNSELFWLDGGHFAYVDDLEKFIAILNAFLDYS